ncbi:MAG TPA: AMIN domain-containing protein, partial [Thermoanaerobaculia bacterium]|nr:AMIN domain-containing protein [Thermoanaerobaculia bacterium]
MLRKAWGTAPALGTRAILGATLVAVFALVGCASRDALQTSRSQDATPAELSGAVQVTGATLLTDGDEPRLLLTGTGPLAPTVYTREEGKRVVVDLANAVTAPGMEPPRADGRLLSQVGMRSFTELGKPHLQFELASRGVVDPKIGTDPSTQAMTVVLARKAEGSDKVEKPTFVAESRPRTATAAEAVRSERLPETSSPAAAEASPASREAIVAPEPVRHAAEGRVATHLRGVTSKRTKEGVEITLAGDGEFSYEAFALESPARYVVDLAGVRNAAPRGAQDVHASRVDRLRVSQFKTTPEPVTRVVFDLAEGTTPTFAPTRQGLVLRFTSSSSSQATVAASSSAPAAQSKTETLAPPKVAQAPEAGSKPVPQPAEAQPVEKVAAVPASGSYERHETEDTHEVVVRDLPPAAPESSSASASTSVPAETVSESTASQPVVTKTEDKTTAIAKVDA